MPCPANVRPRRCVASEVVPRAMPARARCLVRRQQCFERDQPHRSASSSASDQRLRAAFPSMCMRRRTVPHGPSSRSQRPDRRPTRPPPRGPAVPHQPRPSAVAGSRARVVDLRHPVVRCRSALRLHVLQEARIDKQVVHRLRRSASPHHRRPPPRWGQSSQRVSWEQRPEGSPRASSALRSSLVSGSPQEDPVRQCPTCRQSLLAHRRPTVGRRTRRPRLPKARRCLRVHRLPQEPKASRFPPSRRRRRFPPRRRLRRSPRPRTRCRHRLC